MSFTHQWINRLDQFGKTTIDLVIVDSNGVYSARIARKYLTSLVDQAFLDSEFATLRDAYIAAKDATTAASAADIAAMATVAGMTNTQKNTALANWLAGLDLKVRNRLLYDITSGHAAYLADEQGATAQVVP